MKKLSYTLLSLFTVAFLMTDCSKTPDAAPTTVKPSDAEAVSREITFTSSTTKVNGVIPASTTGASTPSITNLPSASVVASGTVYVPVTYTSPTVPSSMYVQVVGAKTFYFNIPLSGVGTSGTVTIPMTISSRVLVGDFSMYICILSSTFLSQPVIVNTSVTEPLKCGNGSVYGSEGVTNTRHQLLGKNGNVTITYDTYSLPDRIDVFLDGNIWKGGTGTSISPPPPTSSCSSPLAGFVGATGTISFAVSTTNKYVDVYVSGCLGSSTAWYYTLTCP